MKSPQETNTVAFRFHEASCVLIGTFNIYIIRPDWLGEVGLLPPGSELKLATQLAQPGVRLSSPSLGSTWTVQPTRFVLETNNPEENCGATVDRLLECLPWTPLTALGCNFAYLGTKADVEGWEAKTVFPPSLTPDGTTLKQRTWHLALEHGEQVYNLQFAETAEGVELRANIHTDLNHRKIDYARNAARGFFDQRAFAEKLIQELLHARIQHADN